MEKELAIELIGGKQFVKLKSELQEMNPADIAFLVEELNSDGEIGEKELILMYRILPKELAAEAFTYMDSDTHQRCFPYTQEHRQRHEKTDKPASQLSQGQRRFGHDYRICLFEKRIDRQRSL